MDGSCFMPVLHARRRLAPIVCIASLTDRTESSRAWINTQSRCSICLALNVWFAEPGRKVMTKYRRLIPAMITSAVLFQARPGTAQTDIMHFAYVSTANQVGVMEYCMGKGWADQAAVDAQKKAAAKPSAHHRPRRPERSRGDGPQGRADEQRHHRLAGVDGTTGRHDRTGSVHPHGLVREDGCRTAVLDAGHARHARREGDADPSSGHDDAGHARDRPCQGCRSHSDRAACLTVRAPQP